MVVETGWQEATLQDLIRLLQPQEAVRALVLFGTTTQAPRGPAPRCAAPPTQGMIDVWSDIDLLLVVAEGALAQFHPAMDWLKPLGELYTWDQSSHPFASTTRVCFSDFRRVDFVITTEGALEQIDQWPLAPFWKGTRTLLSRSPRVDRVLARTFEPPKPRLIPPDEFEAMVNGFWFKGVLAVTKVMRNDLLIALHLALEMVQDCCVLGMLLRDRAEGTAHHRHGGAGNDVVAQLEVTRHSYTASGILDSLEQSSAIFDELAAQWGDAYQEHRRPLQSWISFARLDLTGGHSESDCSTKQPQ